MNDDGGNETDDNCDDSGGHDEEEASVEYPEVRFLGSQFDHNPLQGNQIVLGVENYTIEVTRPEVLTPYQGDIFLPGHTI